MALRLSPLPECLGRDWLRRLGRSGCIGCAVGACRWCGPEGLRGGGVEGSSARAGRVARALGRFQRPSIDRLARWIVLVIDQDDDWPESGCFRFAELAVCADDQVITHCGTACGSTIQADLATAGSRAYSVRGKALTVLNVVDLQVFKLPDSGHLE